jgi:hypothetical protein
MVAEVEWYPVEQALAVPQLLYQVCWFPLPQTVATATVL